MGGGASWPGKDQGWQGDPLQAARRAVRSTSRRFPSVSRYRRSPGVSSAWICSVIVRPRHAATRRSPEHRPLRSKAEGRGFPTRKKCPESHTLSGRTRRELRSRRSVCRQRRQKSLMVMPTMTIQTADAIPSVPPRVADQLPFNPSRKLTSIAGSCQAPRDRTLAPCRLPSRRQMVPQWPERSH